MASAVHYLPPLHVKRGHISRSVPALCAGLSQAAVQILASVKGSGKIHETKGRPGEAWNFCGKKEEEENRGNVLDFPAAREMRWGEGGRRGGDRHPPHSRL